MNNITLNVFIPLSLKTDYKDYLLPVREVAGKLVISKSG